MFNAVMSQAQVNYSQVKGDQISDMTDIVISLAKNEHR
jgi:hypothetical protein